MSDDLERLCAPTTSVEEALALFGQLRTTPRERGAIEAIVTRSRYVVLPEPLLVAVASALVDRGEDDAASAVLAGLPSSPALMLRSDLLARKGDLASAVAVVERVLLRDIDWLGARERRSRWSAALGVNLRTVPRDTGATLASSAPDAPFRLRRELGRGGAGVVYEADDRDLGRLVALKVYHRSNAEGGQLLHEARVAAMLAGRGVVRVFDVEPTQGWLAMELVAGGALRDALRARDIEAFAPIARWALPLAAALGRVHDAGWVHHDVKPANILLRSPDAPLLTDFGIARRAGEPSPPGSLGYVSPERLAGRASDPRDDVYGFGRILEDALDVRSNDADGLRLRVVSGLCTGPDHDRPADGGTLVRLL